MSIIGIGTDIIEISRFEKKQSPGFMARVFSTYEAAYLAEKPPQSMAGLFAAKEAVAKALGTGFAGFSPWEIEIRHDAQGKPLIKLHKKALGIATAQGIKTIHISISHNQDSAIAFAIAE